MKIILFRQEDILTDEEVRFEKLNKFQWCPKYLEKVSPILQKLSLNSVEDCETVTDMILKSID